MERVAHLTGNFATFLNFVPFSLIYCSGHKQVFMQNLVSEIYYQDTSNWTSWTESVEFTEHRGCQTTPTCPHKEDATPLF